LNFKNTKVAIILILTIILIGILLVIFLYKNFTKSTDNTTLQSIWLNPSSDTLEFRYNNHSSFSPSPFNNYYEISFTSKYFTNTTNVFSINESKENIQFSKSYPGFVYNFKDDSNQDYINGDKLISNSTNNNQAYNLTDSNNYLLNCYKIISNEEEKDQKYCINRDDNLLYLLSINSPAKIETKFDKKDYAIRDIIFNNHNKLIIYEYFKSNDMYDDEALLWPSEFNLMISKKPQEQIPFHYVAKINNKEIKLEQISIYSIIKTNGGYIFNTKTLQDTKNRVNNFSIQKMDFEGDLSLIYSNVSSTIIWIDK